MTFTPYVIPSPPQTPVYTKDVDFDLDPLCTDMDPLNLWEKDEIHVLDSPLDSIAHGETAATCGSPCSVCTECCCDACSRECHEDAGNDAGVCSWEDVDVEPLNLAIANTCGKASVAFALPSGCDASSYDGSDDEDSLMDSVMLDSSHETYTPSNFLGMSRDAEKMGSDQVQSMHSCEATFVSPVRTAHENLEKISMRLSKLTM